MAEDPAVQQAQAAFDGGDWAGAYAAYRAQDEQSPLPPGDVERMATCAYLLGRDETCIELLTRAHHGHLQRDDPVGAARCAFWLGFTHMSNRGEMAQAGGWFGRAQRLVEADEATDSVILGYLSLPAAMDNLFAGKPAQALPIFERVLEIAERFKDPDLHALSLLGRGQAHLAVGELARGKACLDEVMVAVTGSEVSAVVAGLVYCAVIESCQMVYDVARAREWTGALSQWCAAQPDLVAYQGECLVHRAEILELRGDWAGAAEEAERARQRFTGPPGNPALGAAMYRKAEVHRLRGEADDADDAYAQAGRWGHDPQPGLALLRKSQHRLDAACAGVERALEEIPDRIRRPRVLAAAVEIALARDDVGTARSHADELVAICRDYEQEVPFLRALAAGAAATVQLAEGDARAALASARRSWSVWRELDIPYEAARARVTVARAARQVGDEDTAAIELSAARAVFEELRAATDLAALEALAPSARGKSDGDLTPRELEVLRLVAAGKTNRMIAADLFLSEKTVARHLANIFTKLGISSRSSATAYAFQQDLV